MATTAHFPISASEYLHTSYHPDWNETVIFAVADSPIHIDQAAIFAAIDEDRSR
jgi:hypothetical protein